MTPITIEQDLTEGELLVRDWRLEQLLAAGYPADDALRIARDSSIDLEQARRLARLGCPPELAVRILT